MMRHAPRDLDAIRLIAIRRFLTRLQLEELLFAGVTLTPRSRQVLAWRVLGRLRQDGYVSSTPRQAGGFYGGSSLPAYFLTAAGLRLASSRSGARRRPPKTTTWRCGRRTGRSGCASVIDT